LKKVGWEFQEINHIKIYEVEKKWLGFVVEK